MNEHQFELFCRALSEHAADHVIVYQHGKLLARHDWVPEARQNQYSLSKSFTGTAAGFALAEGLFEMDTRISELLPDYMPENPCEELKELSVRHLLTMTAGQQRPLLMGDSRKTLKETDWTSYVLSVPFSDHPGRVFMYSNTGPYLISRIIEEKTGGSLTDYLMPRLFEPLDIPRPEWEEDPEGHIFGAGGMVLSSSEVMRFGQLYLQQGVWNGKQILPEGWVRKVERTAIPTNRGDGEYSLLFWKSRNDTYSAVGKFGQYCTICPEKDAVIVINALDKDDPNLLEYVWTYLYPYI
ncbi:serine hydrolase [Hominifimenecus microfluidus]|uniref:serine hydrolase domain-containing protein n=1 Tax=Hominifimenecus microfluidus TaxID=2885348 RepID=UPI002F9E384B